jgi:hypothetical protein
MIFTLKERLSKTRNGNCTYPNQSKQFQKDLSAKTTSLHSNHCDTNNDIDWQGICPDGNQRRGGLGVWLDNNLDWHRSSKRYIIKKLARLTTNGRTLHPHSAIRAIKAAFIPKLLYGIELFWKDNQKIEHKLQVIINHAIRFAFSAFLSRS